MSDNGATYVSEHDLDEDVQEYAAYDERPLRTGRRISGRALFAAVVILAIPAFIMVHGIWAATNTRIETAHAADGSVASWKDVKTGAGDDGKGAVGQQNAAPFLPTDTGYATAPPARRLVSYAKAAGQAAGNAAGSGAAAAANYVNQQTSPNYAPDGGAAQMGDVTQYSGNAGGGNYVATMSPAQAAEQARLDALAVQQKLYQEALHASSGLKVDGAPSTLPSATARHVVADGDAAQGAQEVIRPAIQPATGTFIVAAWQRIDVVMDDAIRASGTVTGSDGGGTAWGHLTKDVPDATGTVIMFPQGTRVKLAYESPKAGQRELQASWTRLVYPPQPDKPCCRWISLLQGEDHGIRAGDSDGADAVSVRVDDHQNHLVRVALTGAAVSVIPIALAGSPSSVLQNPNPLQQAGQGLGQRINDTVNRMTDAEFSLPPTFYMSAGSHVIIKLDKDISVTPYAPKG